MVLADGVFDPIHVGHIRYLQAAATLGNPLFVRVAPDTAIVAKGRAPFQTQHERVVTISAIRCVGFAFPAWALADAIADWKPEILVKGREWEGALPEDVQAACQRVGTRIVYTDTQERASTERLAG